MTEKVVTVVLRVEFSDQRENTTHMTQSQNKLKVPAAKKGFGGFPEQERRTKKKIEGRKKKSILSILSN